MQICAHANDLHLLYACMRVYVCVLGEILANHGTYNQGAHPSAPFSHAHLAK